jgi:hypothetical protein
VIDSEELEERLRTAVRAVANLPTPERARRATGGPQPRTSKRRVSYVTAAVTVAVAAVVSFAVAYGPLRSRGTVQPPIGSSAHSSTPGVAPLSDASLTPAGWSPVSLGNVQISVPSSWSVEDPLYDCGSRGGGMVFINHAPTSPPQGLGCALAPNTVELSTTTSAAPQESHRKTINGIPVTIATSKSFTIGTVFASGTEVVVQGPLAAKVLATLTRSPQSVVLHSSVDSVPSGWRRVSFGGLRFAVPGQWTLQREAIWEGCPGNIAGGVLELSTAERSIYPSCEGVPNTAGSLAASPGMVLGSGPQVQRAPADATCLTRHGLRICIDPPPPPNGGYSFGHELDLLTAQVKVPGQADIDQIEIGLTGNGMTPLEIFDSLKPHT